MSLFSKTISGTIGELSQISAYIIPLVGPREDIFVTECVVRNIIIKFDSLICKNKYNESYIISLTINSNDIQNITNTILGIANYDLRKKVIDISVFSYNNINFIYKNIPSVEPDVLVNAEFQLTECPNIKGSYCTTGKININKQTVNLFGDVNVAYNNLYSKSILKIN